MTCRAVIALALALAVPLASRADARDIAGELAYRERIALPPGAELLVVVSDPTGPVAETRQTPGGQVPLPFAVTAPDDGPLTLRAAVFEGGQPVWISAEIPVPAGQDAVNLGQIPLHRHVPLGFASTFLCGDRLIDLGFAGDAARLRVGGQVIELAPVPAASGARFEDAAGTSFWSKGNRALVTLAGTALPECLPVIAPTLPLIARGNEPSWTITVAHEGLVYAGMDGARREFPLPAATQTDAGTVFDTGDGLAVTVSETLCRDTMTGLPHPYSIAATLDGAALQGCGGDPLAVLAGDWRLIDLPGITEPDSADVTLSVAGTRVAGKAGCNRFAGGLTLTGESLTLQPGGMTMMACDEALMTFEAAFIDRLSQVTLFDIDAAGNLVLIVDGAPGAVFSH